MGSLGCTEKGIGMGPRIKDRLTRQLWMLLLVLFVILVYGVEFCCVPRMVAETERRIFTYIYQDNVLLPENCKKWSAFFGSTHRRISNHVRKKKKKSVKNFEGNKL
jgi:hypothetical protein